MQLPRNSVIAQTSAPQVSGGQLKKLFFDLKEIAALEVLRIYLIALQVIDGELSRS